MSERVAEEWCDGWRARGEGCAMEMELIMGGKRGRRAGDVCVREEVQREGRARDG